MRIRHCTLISAGLLLLAIPAFAAGRTPAKRHYHGPIKHAAVRHAAVRHSYEKHSAGRHSSSSHARGSRAALHREPVVVMPVERVTQIQTALIKQGYMTGEPSGAWDASTIAAMQKLQADNGWQTKITPDSRALIKLGLGPQTPVPVPSAVAGAASTPSTDQARALAQAPPQ